MNMYILQHQFSRESTLIIVAYTGCEILRIACVVRAWCVRGACVVRAWCVRGACCVRRVNDCILLYKSDCYGVYLN